MMNFSVEFVICCCGTDLPSYVLWMLKLLLSIFFKQPQFLDMYHSHISASCCLDLGEKKLVLEVVAIGENKLFELHWKLSRLEIMFIQMSWWFYHQYCYQGDVDNYGRTSGFWRLLCLSACLQVVGNVSLHNGKCYCIMGYVLWSGTH